MTVIFAKSFKNAKLTQDQNGRSVFEEHIKTLRIKKIKNKYVLQELFRKNKKPETLKKFPVSKYKSQQELQSAIEQDKIKLNTSIKETYQKLDGSKFTITQDNFRSNKKNPQVVAFVRVVDERRKITDFFTCYSKKLGFDKDTGEKRTMKEAEKSIIIMALYKFGEAHGHCKTGDIKAEILETRFQYYS